MSIATEVVSIKYFAIVANTPIAVSIPAFEASDIKVFYTGKELLAVQGTDYSVVLAEDFNTFTITPLPSLLTKIAAVIADDPTETNFIIVARELDYLTDASPQQVRFTPFTAREFDRTAMRFQQVEERLDRALTVSRGSAKVGPMVGVETGDLLNKYLKFTADGLALEPGAPADAFQAVQVFSPYASRSAAESAIVANTVTHIQVGTPSGRVLTYDRNASTAAITTADGATWGPSGAVYPDHFAENLEPGVTDMRAAVESAITAGNASLLPQAYGMAGGAVIDGDDLSLYMPQGSSIVALDNSNNPLDINGERFTLFGPGEIDCGSIVSGIVAASTAKGLHVSGVSIKNPTARGINCQDNFDADDQTTIEDVTIYWDTAGAAAVDQSVLPLVINIQGTGTNNIIGVNLLRNTVDMSNWTAEKISLIAYPLVSGAPNPVLFRMNQNGTGTISSQNRCEGNRALFPVVPDEGQWDPSFYGNAPDGVGQRRPVCYEIKTTAANGVGAMSFDGNFGDGGDIGASFGSLNGLNYTNNRMQFQTHYCMEAATGDKITGAGNYYDGRFALKPISSTNTRIVNLPGSFVIGPRHDGGTSETAVALQGTTEIINMAGSTFIAATAGPIVRLLGESATNEIANFDGCVFVGNGVVGVDAVEVRNMIATLSLNGATFQDIDGDTLNNLSTIGTLITIGMSEENCGGTATLGTVTRHLSALNNAGAFTSGIELAPEVPSLSVRAGLHDWHYAGSAFASFRNDRDVSLSAPTDDASDTGSFFVSGGGSHGQFRGGTLTLYGNEHLTFPGQAILEGGVNRNATVRSQGTGDVVLDPAGTGRARFGTHSAIGAETVTGFIEIKDSSGTLRKLAVVS